MPDYDQETITFSIKCNDNFINLFITESDHPNMKFLLSFAYWNKYTKAQTELCPWSFWNDPAYLTWNMKRNPLKSVINKDIVLRI